jgi:NHLM bacteriocin system ABC transporter ATP-binding protein
MLNQLFERFGRSIKVEANSPLLLEESASVSLVSSGSVEIFAVAVSGGSVVGTRHHLATIEAGEILFEIGPARTEEGLHLLAVGSPGTKLFRLSTRELQERSADIEVRRSIASSVDHWVETLSRTLPGGAPPRKYVVLAAAEDLQFDAGSVGQVASGVLWIGQDSGRSNLVGDPSFPLRRGLGALPVSTGTWIEAVDSGSISVANTLELLHTGSLWADLAGFHAAVLVAAAENVGRVLETERERLRRRSEADRRVMARAISELASTMDAGLPEQAVESNGDDALLTACRAVAQAQGITIVKPPRSRAPDTAIDRLNAIARSSRLRVRRIALRDDWWRRDNGPLLAFLEDGNPVALLQSGAHNYVQVDPVARTRVPVTRDGAESLASFAFMFYRPFPNEVLTAVKLLRFGLRAGPLRDGVMVIVMGIVTGLLALFTPIATGVIFDDIIPSAERQQLLQLIMALAVMAIAGGLFRLTRGLAMLRLESKMGAAVQAGVWDRMLKLPAPFFRKYLAGDLARRSLGIDTIRRLLTGATMSSLLSGVFSIFSFALLFYYSAQLALIATVLVLVAAAATAVASVRELHYERALQEVAGKIEGLVLQFITGISKLRVAGAEARAFSVWAREFTRQKRLSYKARNVENALGIFNSVFPLISSMTIFATLAFFTARAVETGGTPLSTGAFLAFNAAFGQFMAAALEVNSVLVSLLLIVPVYERAKPILETLPEVDTEKGDPGELNGEIEVNNVSFRYHDDGPLVLDNVSLRVRAGEFVAVVGPSGAGKSSLLRLLLGFESAESGSVYYDGQDLTSLDVQAVRRQIGVVMQNAQVLPGSLFDNIVGSAPLTLEDATAAASMAGLDQDIEQMPMGMHTFIPEGGSTLSGGQRQRLLIARAVVGRPRILLFDEATSALDNQTQAHVSDSLERLKTTRVVIAHRLSTIVNADRIYVMDSGKIVQAGSYDELMRQEGPFVELASRQIA